MAYDPRRPTTTANCATRAALERTLGDPHFLHESIHARHTAQQREQHQANLARRAQGNVRTAPKQQKAK